ncbi:MAG: hypothetical protein ACOCXT_05695 [Candidatus Dojkabacteria bacterium]
MFEYTRTRLANALEQIILPVFPSDSPHSVVRSGVALFLPISDQKEEEEGAAFFKAVTDQEAAPMFNCPEPPVKLLVGAVMSVVNLRFEPSSSHKREITLSPHDTSGIVFPNQPPGSLYVLTPAGSEMTRLPQCPLMIPLQLDSSLANEVIMKAYRGLDITKVFSEHEEPEKSLPLKIIESRPAERSVKHYNEENGSQWFVVITPQRLLGPLGPFKQDINNPLFPVLQEDEVQSWNYEVALPVSDPLTQGSIPWNRMVRLYGGDRVLQVALVSLLQFVHPGIADGLIEHIQNKNPNKTRKGLFG